MATKLDQELKTYQAHRDELLGRAEGRYILIRNDELIGTFESQQDALQQGYEKFGNKPFLVKQVVEVEVPQNFTSFPLGV